MPDRFGNPEKARFKEERMVNREYDEIVDEPTIVSKTPEKKIIKNSEEHQDS